MPTNKPKPIPNAIEKNKPTVKKKVDMRIQHLLTNAIQQHHRSFLVMVGEHGMDQIMNLHFFLTNHWVKRPSVLWCYKKDLGFSSNRKKRMKYLATLAKKGLRDQDTANPFDSFISTTDIRYCYYKETQNILGNTYGMLVLQDFEAITPNILARTMECIQGGGLIVILLKSGDSLKQLHSLSMDVHARYKTSQFNTVIPRFNERFIMSLMNCDNCLVIDDELTVLPVSQGKHVKPPPTSNVTAMTSLLEVQDAPELASLKLQHEDNQILYNLLQKTKTTDQASALVEMGTLLTSGNLQSTLALTAGRGRGKSAALGLGLAAAIAHGYSNIFVTSPSAENLKTFFEFVFMGLEALNYKQHADYDFTSNNNLVTRINIFKNHRQTIQYINPDDHLILQQAELLIIDEAAAIPLTKIRLLLKHHAMTWLSSTVNGYEGTGRSLSLKLLAELKDSKSTVFVETTLEMPIRYKPLDPVEHWLNTLLCLNAQPPPSIQQLPCPQQCQLVMVNRDTLFSHHAISEIFLNQLVGLFVTSHYKNQPNDLQLMSDAPAHRLFVLIPPTASNALPTPLVVIQVCIEGKLQPSNNNSNSGDLIPHVLQQQYQLNDFGTLNGLRIVRIATHPNFQRMGYGKYAMDQLIAYYTNPQMTNNHDSSYQGNSERGELHYAPPSQEDQMNPLLIPLTSRQPEDIDYVGVSYGLTMNLFKFWSRQQFNVCYIRQTMNASTGEHTCIMLHPLKDNVIRVVDEFKSQLLDRFIVLLSFTFKSFDLTLCTAIIKQCQSTSTSMIDASTVLQHYTLKEIKRLKYFTLNIIDYHVLLDLFPKLATHVMLEQIQTEEGDALQLSHVLKSILLGIGLQRKTINDISVEMKIPCSQVLALMTKGIKKVYSSLEGLLTQQMDHENGQGVVGLQAPAEHVPLAVEPSITIDEELEEEASEMQKESLKQLDLEHYKIDGKLDKMQEANGDIIAVPSKKRKMLQKGLKKKQKK